jgi:hypothetical protein
MIRTLARRPRTAAILMGALTLGAAGSAFSSTVPVGVVSAFAGKVVKSTATAPKGTPITLKQRIVWGDVLRTGKKSQLHLLLLDKSSITLGSSAVLTIDRFVYDPSKPRSLAASASKGAFRFMSGKRDPRASAAVNTPVGSIGIRGTAVDAVIGENAIEIARAEPAVGKDVVSDKAGATLVVLRGPGPLTAGNLTPGLVDVTAAGRTVLLDRPALAAYIPRPGAPPIGPFTISAPGLARVQDLLAPSVTQANKGGLGLAVPAAIVGGIVGSGVLGGGGGGGGSTGQPRCVPSPTRAC